MPFTNRTVGADERTLEMQNYIVLVNNNYHQRILKSIFKNNKIISSEDTCNSFPKYYIVKFDKFLKSYISLPISFRDYANKMSEYSNLSLLPIDISLAQDIFKVNEVISHA